MDLVNGQSYDWESIEVNLPYGPIIQIESIEYGDKQEAEANYGRGDKPTGFGQGNYSAEGKLTIKREELIKLEAYRVAQKKASIYKLPLFPIVVSYANDDQLTIVDVLPQCKFTERQTSPKQGDKSVNVDLSFIVLAPIVWGA